MYYDVLVTGGAGFIGSNLCRKLLNMGKKVFCIDNLSSGYLENIEDLNKEEKFLFLEHDIITPIDIKVGQIYNFACPASPSYYQKNPIATIQTNVIGSMNLLDLAVKNNARILQASTSEIYGNPLVHPQTETYFGNVNPIGIRACYDEGKRMAETLFFDYKRFYGIDTRVIRIFNTYGPGMSVSDGRVIPNFCNQALNNEDITIYGDGKQSRSFCYIDDLIDGMIKVMEYEGVLETPINLGSMNEITVYELAEEIIRQTESKSKISFNPLPSDDPVRRKPDICLADEFLNWKPKVTLQEGIRKVMEYYKEQKG